MNSAAADIRLIASDVDGTILRADGTVSERTSRAFAAARAAGIHVVFVTGRPFRWLRPLQEAFGDLGTVICSNGALIYSQEEARILRCNTLDARTVDAVRRRILAIHPDAVFAAETTVKLYVEPGFVEPGKEHLLEGETPAPLPLDLLGAEGTVKLLAKLHDGTSEDFHAAVQAELADLVAVTHSAPGVALLEMCPPAINKAVALEEYAAELGLGRHQVAAFGDMPNDVEMLAWAGLGCAVGSGHVLAKEAAAVVTEGVEDDGVARVIEQILAERGRTVSEAGDAVAEVPGSAALGDSAVPDISSAPPAPGGTE